MAVRRRANDGFSGEVGARADPVLDKEWLAKTFRKPLTGKPRTMSDEPPAAKPTRMRTGRLG